MANEGTVAYSTLVAASGKEIAGGGFPKFKGDAAYLMAEFVEFEEMGKVNRVEYFCGYLSKT